MLHALLKLISFIFLSVHTSYYNTRSKKSLMRMRVELTSFYHKYFFSLNQHQYQAYLTGPINTHQITGLRSLLGSRLVAVVHTLYIVCYFPIGAIRFLHYLTQSLLQVECSWFEPLCVQYSKHGMHCIIVQLGIQPDCIVSHRGNWRNALLTVSHMSHQKWPLNLKQNMLWKAMGPSESD